MAPTVRIFFPVLMVYLGCDHCTDCRPDRETETSVENIRSRKLRTDWYTLPNGTYFCGDRSYGKTPLTRREINELGDNDLDSGDETIADPDLDKILGGVYAFHGDTPWMATIIYYGWHWCGGAIISKFWIVSAAHCFHHRGIAGFKIAVGDHVLRQTDESESVHEVKLIIIHEQYRSPSKDFDIALIKIKADKDGFGINLDYNVQPICLPTSTENPGVDTRLTFAGWGYTSTAKKKPTYLKRVSLYTLSQESCMRLYGNTLLPHVFCAGVVNGDSDLCEGDNGGPAASRNLPSFITGGRRIGGPYVLSGIFIASTGCKPPNNPALFTSIPKLRAWILATINQYSSGQEKVMPVPYNGPYKYR